MVDYYEELSLVKELDIKHIQEELVRLESLWHKREVNSPEKANKMLGLIMDAQKVFASEASRRKYDRDLVNGKKEPEDPDISRSKLLEKWTNQARAFYDDGQYDLAKVAIEKAISLSNINGDDDILFALAADIYKNNGDLDIAMSYINRAIVAAPDISVYYLSKGIIYDFQASAALESGNYSNTLNIRTEARKMFRIACMKAEEADDFANKARAYGALAFSFYFQEPMDKEEGENFANLAVKFGGDSWGNADKVLNEINAIQEEIRRKELELEEEARKKKIEEENARKEAIYTEAKKMGGLTFFDLSRDVSIGDMEKAISKFKSISDYRDSAKQIETLVAKIQKAADAEIEKQTEIEKRKNRIKRVIYIAIPIIAVAIISGMFIHNIYHQKCGENLKWSYDAETKVLTITGTGPMYDDYDPYASLFEGRKRPWDSDSLCDEIETIIIEDGCTRIGEEAFSSFSELTNIEIPNSVTSIGDSAFDWCENLEKIDLPSNLVSIDGTPFSASGIKVLYLPASIESLDTIAGKAYNLEEITVDPDNPYFTSYEGVLFNNDMTILWAYPPAKSGSSYSVPEGVTEIRSFAFYEDEEYEYDNLESINIPEGVIRIGDDAFYMCFNLTEIVVPLSVESISQRAFAECGTTDSVIYYSGTQAQWLSFANDLDFIGTVECSDGSYRYYSKEENTNW